MNIDILVWCFLITIGISLITIPFLPTKIKSVTAFFLVLILSIASSIPAINVLTGSPIEEIFYGGSVFGNIPLRIDSLSAWFILMVNFTFINGALYGAGYMKLYEDQKENTTFHWILFVIFQIAMISVCILQNGLAFLIAWEIMSISAFLLLIFEHDKPEILKAGMNYLVQTHIGVVFLSIGFIWVYFSESSFDFISIASFFSLHSPKLLFLIFFIGPDSADLQSVPDSADLQSVPPL